MGWPRVKRLHPCQSKTGKTKINFKRIVSALRQQAFQRDRPAANPLAGSWPAKSVLPDLAAASDRRLVIFRGAALWPQVARCLARSYGPASRTRRANRKEGPIVVSFRMRIAPCHSSRGACRIYGNANGVK